MALLGDGIALRLDDPGNASAQYDASDDRDGFTGLMMAGGAGIAVRAGRRPGTLSVTVGGSPESVSVPPLCGVVTDPDGGAYLFATNVTVGKTLATRPASGTSRIDIVVARVYDADVHPADTTKRELDIEVLTGTAGASPSEPTIPNGALRIATLTVPASGSVTVSVNGPRHVSAGGILPVSNQSARDSLTAYDGLMVYREDTDVFEGYFAGAWKTITRGEDTPQAGSVSIDMAGNSTKTVTINFPHAFTVAPAVTLTTNQANIYGNLTTNPTTGNVGVRVSTRDGTTSTATVTLFWTAIPAT